MREFYTTKQLAELCGVHITTAMRWFDTGELKGWKTPGGRRRIAADELSAFVERHKIPLRKPLPSSQSMLLVVSDDAQVAKAANKLGKQGHHHVMTAANLYDALVSAGATPPDLVILDLTSKAADGLEALAALKRQPSTSSIPVLALTGTSPDQRKKATSAGAADCRTKDEAISDLGAAVTASLGR